MAADDRVATLDVKETQVLIFTFMVLYGAGIICTRTIGHGTIFGDADLNSDVTSIQYRSKKQKEGEIDFDILYKTGSSNSKEFHGSFISNGMRGIERYILD